MIPKDIEIKIKEASNIVDIVKDYLPLKKQGVNYVGKCPFHDEKSASFIVSPSKGICKCFGCGKGGDVAHFIMEVEQYNYREALLHLAKRASIEVTESENPEEIRKQKEREGIILLNKLAQHYWSTSLKASSAYAYFTKRGYTDKDINKFSIGVAMPRYNDLLGYLSSKGYTQAQIQHAGLASKNERGYMDRFINRLQFPIQDITGRYIGFTGRILDANDKMAKYLNTPETVVYSKSRVLYGLYQAKQAIVKSGRANLVEGNTDVIRMHQVGQENTVATCGTAFTQEQARLLFRYTQNLSILYDGDNAGVNATHKAARIALSANFNVHVCFFEPKEDPDTFFKGKTSTQAAKWIEENEKDYILWSAEEASKEKDPGKRSESIKELFESISLIPDAISKDIYLKEVVKLVKIDASTVQLKEPEKVGKGELFGWDIAEKAIKSKKAVHLYNSKEAFTEALNNVELEVVSDKKGVTIHTNFPGVVYDGSLNPEAIGKLKLAVKELRFEHNLPRIFNEGGYTETQEIKLLKFLNEQRFNLKFKGEGKNGLADFPLLYLQAMAEDIDVWQLDSKKLIIELAAQFLAKQDTTTRSLCVAESCKMFGLTKAELNQIIKPYIANETGKKKQRDANIEIDGTPRVFDINNLPDYVDEQFFRRYRFFPAQNSKGEKIFYVFADEHGNLKPITNFYMEPKFHIADEDRNKNKRVLELRIADIETTRFIEVLSDDMVEFNAFKKYIFRLGYCMFKGGARPIHLDAINESMNLNFPKAHEFETYGMQGEGFFAFVNGIITPDGIKQCDEMGLVSYKDKTYYSPAVSRMFEELRRDQLIDKFGIKYYLQMKPENHITFQKWSNLFHRVYKYNDNNMWALTMTIMSAFRSDIFPIRREFTTLFFIGGTDSGKSKIAQSMRAMYMDPEAPMFNLNSGTDAAFFSLLEQMCDVPVVFEEYNDTHVSDIKFQGLKAAVFDGEGRAKRKDATSNDLVYSKVRAIPILLGQESAERDDRSLGNRCVECQVKKKTDWSNEETSDFELLKEYEQLGLSHILVQILRQRKIIQRYYRENLSIEHDKLRRDMMESNTPFVTRICKTISFFTAFIKTWNDHAPSDMHFPFTYDEFYPIAHKKLAEQSESITATNRLSSFFAALLTLSGDSRNGIKEGREYKIEKLDSISLRHGQKKIEKINYDDPKYILFLSIDTIHVKYRNEVGAAEHLNKNNLLAYLKDHPSYIGPVKQTTFTYEEEVRVNTGDNNRVESRMEMIKKRTSAIALDYDLLRNNYDFDLGIKMFSHEANGLYGEQANYSSHGDKISESKAIDAQKNAASGIGKPIQGKFGGKKDDLPF